MHRNIRRLSFVLVIAVSASLLISSNVFALLNASLISDNIMSEMHPGERRRLGVIIENTGDEPWSGTGFRLQSISVPADTWSFRLQRRRHVASLPPTIVSIAGPFHGDFVPDCISARRPAGSRRAGNQSER